MDRANGTVRRDPIHTIGNLPLRHPRHSHALLRLRGAGQESGRHAAELEAWRGGPHTGDDDELPQQWLVRWKDRLSLFRRLPDGALLYVATRPGHTNEPWLRLQVDAALPATQGADAP